MSRCGCNATCRLLAACWILSGCVEVTAPPGPFDDLDFSGSWNPAANFGGPFGHDGDPVVSTNFAVYSGTASRDAKAYASGVAEAALADVLDVLEIDTGAFDFLPGSPDRRIDILAIKDQPFGNNTGFAYRDGVVIISRESPKYREFGFDEERYRRLVTHEGAHVVEFLLIGEPSRQQASDVWWREGFAHYLSGPRPSMITTPEALEAWRADHAGLPGNGNPVSVHVWDDFPASIRDAGQTFSYYDVFELTVRYVLDPDGHGASPPDVVAVYDALGDGASFAEAMLDHLGVDVERLEADFWDTLAAYLEARAP